MTTYAHWWSPGLLWYRVTHYFLGRRRGCSCNKCFHNPHRRIPPAEFYRDRVRLAKVEEAMRDHKKGHA